MTTTHAPPKRSLRKMLAGSGLAISLTTGIGLASAAPASAGNISWTGFMSCTASAPVATRGYRHIERWGPVDGEIRLTAGGRTARSSNDGFVFIQLVSAASSGTWRVEGHRNVVLRGVGSCGPRR